MLSTMQSIPLIQNPFLTMLFLKKQHQYLVLILLLCGNLIAVAQEPKKNIIDFGKGGKVMDKKDEKKADNTNGTDIYEQNAIFLDGASLMAGFVSVGYERAITSKLAAEVSLGITFFAYNDAKLQEIAESIAYQL
jgi:hypothetical protein